MPRPPILPTLDWSHIHGLGRDFETWVAAAEKQEHAEKMRASVARQHLEATTVAALAGLTRDVNVVAFAEDWCGDVVRHVPVLQAMALVTPRLRVRYLEREEAPNTFVRFLTNGGEAIPKFVFLSSDWIECGNWGPMPDADRRLIARGKACQDLPGARERVSASYAADKGRHTVVSELLECIMVASAEIP